MRYFRNLLSDIRLLPNGPLIVHTGMFVSALVVCAAIGVMASATIVSLTRVPEATAKPVILAQAGEPGKTGKTGDRLAQAVPLPPPRPERIDRRERGVTGEAAGEAGVRPDGNSPSFGQRWAPVYSEPPRVSEPPPPVRIIPLPSQPPPESKLDKPVRVAESEQELVAPRPAIAPPAHRKSRDTRDVCERHGMRKVERNGGRSWRCRR